MAMVIAMALAIATAMAMAVDMAMARPPKAMAIRQKNVPGQTPRRIT